MGRFCGFSFIRACFEGRGIFEKKFLVLLLTEIFFVLEVDQRQ
jgi:hypothetical protein